MAVGLPPEHMAVKAHTVLLRQPLERLAEEDFGDANGFVDLIARAPQGRTRDDPRTKFLTSSKEAVSCPNTHRPCHQADLPIRAEIELEVITTIVPEDE